MSEASDANVAEAADGFSSVMLVRVSEPQHIISDGTPPATYVLPSKEMLLHVYECGRCGAIVGDRVLHGLSHSGGSRTDQ